MADAITIKALQDASLDAKSLEDVVNGDEAKQVTTRKGETYPSVKKAIKTLFENGGLPATAYKTYDGMVSSGSDLPSGAYAVVTEGEQNGLYLKDGDSWSKSDYNFKKITSDILDRRIYDNESKNVFEFSDGRGVVGFAVDEYGYLKSSNITTEYNRDYGFIVADDYGKAALAVDHDGNLHSPTIYELQDKVKDIQSVLNVGGSGGSDESSSSFRTDYMHIISYGQSLSRGHLSKPVLSTEQPYNNLTFKSGVLPRSPDSNIDYSGFKPLVEEEVGAEGESPTSAMLNTLVKHRVDRGEDPKEWVFVGTATGRAAQSINSLKKGTTYYNSTIEQVQAAYDLAQSEGKTYSLWAMSWTQGEADYKANRSMQAYYDLVKEMYDDFVADFKVITGQSLKFPFVHYQVAAHRYYEKDDMPIALAHLKLSEDFDEFILATPVYQMATAPDNLHLTSGSSHQLGKYYAKALSYTLFSGKKWQPLKPVNLFKQARVISLEFNKRGLVFDTTQVALSPNFGFDIWANGAVVDIIESVSIKGSNRLSIVLNGEVPIGAKLTYARGRTGDAFASGNKLGARGNLRDSDGDNDYYIGGDGKSYYLHNWCVMFELDLI